MIWCRSALGLSLAVLLAAAPTASATSATIQVTSTEVQLKKGTAGWTTQAEVRNMTNGPVSVSAEAKGCSLTVGGGTALELGPGDPRTLTIAAPKSCNLKDRLEVTLRSDDTAIGLIATTGEPEPDPLWEVLLAFAPALVMGALLALIMIELSREDRRKLSPEDRSELSRKKRLRQAWNGRREMPREKRRELSRKDRRTELPGIESSWSFEDSWITNVTAAGALIVTGLGTSDALKAILGEESDATIGVATVTTALGAALAAAGGVVVVAAKRKDSDSITINGLGAAGAIAFGAGAGQVWAITALLVDGDFMTLLAKVLVVLAAVVATVLLGWYTVSSFARLLTKTAATPEPDPLGAGMSDAVLAALVSAAAAGETVSRKQVDALRKNLASSTTPPATRPRAVAPRASAMF